MSGTTFWRFLAGAFTLAVIAIGVFGAWRLLGPLGPIETERQQASYTQPLTRIVFTDFEASDITVEGSAGTTIEIIRELRWTGSKPRHTESWEGQTLRVSHNCGDADDDECSIAYRVRLPESVEVHAETSSGDVTVAGLTAPVGLETVSGHVTLTALKGRVTVKTTSGDVSTSDLASAQAAVTTTSGNATLEFSVAPRALSVHTTSGDARVVVPSDRQPYRLSVRTVSGDQRVNVDASQSADRSIDAESTSGDVTIGYA